MRAAFMMAHGGNQAVTVGEFRDFLAFVERTAMKSVIGERHALENIHAALDRLESGA